MWHLLTPHPNVAVLGLAVVMSLVACSDNDKTRPSPAAGGSSATAGAPSDAGAPSVAGGGMAGAVNATAGSGASAGRSAVGSGGATTVPGCAAPVEVNGFVEVSALDPAIRYVGRVVTTSKSVAFAYPAVQIQTVFEGDAVDLRLRDNGLGRAADTNYYWVIVDGVPSKLRVCQESEVYPLARNLGPGPHTLTIVKRTESSPGGQGNAGYGEFLGLRVRSGTALTPGTPNGRRLEFVGDSITCGYGNELSVVDPTGYKFTSINEDAWNAYGAITARALSADYVAVAASGRGITRNYSDSGGPLMAVLYERALPDNGGAPPWDHARYSPDVIVVNLGTNDYSPGIALDRLESFRANFVQKYIELLTRIRQVHSLSTIVAVVGPMLNDSFPEGYLAWTSIQADVAAVVAARRADNDADVHYFAFEPQQAPYGEDWHPTVATHQQMADALVPFIATLRGW